MDFIRFTYNEWKFYQFSIDRMPIHLIFLKQISPYLHLKFWLDLHPTRRIYFIKIAVSPWDIPLSNANLVRMCKLCNANYNCLMWVSSDFMKFASAECKFQQFSKHQNAIPPNLHLFGASSVRFVASVRCISYQIFKIIFQQTCNYRIGISSDLHVPDANFRNFDQICIEWIQIPPDLHLSDAGSSNFINIASSGCKFHQICVYSMQMSSDVHLSNTNFIIFKSIECKFKPNLMQL